MDIFVDSFNHLSATCLSVIFEKRFQIVGLIAQTFLINIAQSVKKLQDFSGPLKNDLNFKFVLL